MVAEKFFDGVAGLVAAAKPDHFVGRAMKGGPCRQNGVQGHKDESVGLGVSPKIGIMSLG